MKSFFRLAAAFLLLPLCAGTAGAFLLLLESLRHAPAASLPFFLGWGSYALIHLALFKPLRTYVFGHELTHALAALMIGGRVKKFRVSKNSGSVHLTKTNAFVALAPYCFPLYTALLILGFYTAGFFWPVDRWEGIFVYALGLTLAFHFFLTIYAMLQDQPDISQSGLFFSLVVIFLSNVVISAFVLSLLSPKISMRHFARNSWQNAQQVCRLIGAQSKVYWKHMQVSRSS